VVARDSLSADVIVEAAVARVDSHGMDSLTLRTLGEDLGAHFTSLYRHFRNKEELIAAMFEYVLRDVSDDVAKAPDEPIARIRSIAMAFRRALHRHPALVGTIVATEGTESSFALQSSITQDLAALGVPTKEIATRYQMLESYVFGASMFDYLGAPNHLKHRRQRHSSSGLKEFSAASKSEKSVDSHNEAAFAAGLDAILIAICGK
jgi:AcrR family transcriptional regulator